MLQPLAMLAAVSIAFSKVTTVNTGDVPYVVFALAGLAVWTYVQFTFAVAPTTLPSNQLVVRRSPCPRIALVTGTLISVLPPLAVVLTASIGAAAISGTSPFRRSGPDDSHRLILLSTWGLTLLAAALGVASAT